MPRALQCCSKTDVAQKWKSKLDQLDLFVGTMEGSDGEINHAIGIYNGWIFDSNEEIAIPLCNAGLDYCVSAPGLKVEFLEFKRAFVFKPQKRKIYKAMLKVADNMVEARQRRSAPTRHEN